MTTTEINGEQNRATFIFAHGAGAGLDHPFMEAIASQLAQSNILVIRFNFPYMVRQKEENKRRPPDRAPKLLEAFESVINEFAVDGPVVIGGKSMGGRMASLLEEHNRVAGIACLGFPFHPPGKPERFKGEHLSQLTKPCLILQGERDTFGPRVEVEEMNLSSSITVEYISDGDHSFKPRKKSGLTEEENLSHAAKKLSHFILEVLDEK
ncbi:alpha/beta family hydrolase [Vibrio sp. RC27]